MTGNYLDASGLIIQRLVSQRVADANKIRAAPSDRWVVANQLDASVAVIFYDDVPDVSPGGQVMRGKTKASEQFWQVVVSARNVADSGNAARQDAGVMLLQILTALQGWQPSSRHGALHRQKSPFRATDSNGFVHLPLLFSTHIITTGSVPPR